MATNKANRLKPRISAPPPSHWTALTVRTLQKADPRLAAVRLKEVIPSRSRPTLVNAGSMDQKGMSIMV